MPRCCSHSVDAPVHKSLHINHKQLDVQGRRLGSPGCCPNPASQASVHVFKLHGREDVAAHFFHALVFWDLQNRNRCILCLHTKQRRAPRCSSHCLMARQRKWSGMSRQDHCSGLRPDICACLRSAKANSEDNRRRQMLHVSYVTG